MTIASSLPLVDSPTSIFEDLCAELGLDPFSSHPRYVVIIPPRQRAVDTSSVRAIEAGPKSEVKTGGSEWTPAPGARNVLGVGNTDNHRGPDIGSDPATEEEPMIDIDTAATAVATGREHEVTVTVLLADGNRVTGTPISVNSKGVNLKIEGKTRSFGLTRIDGITADLPVIEPETDPNATFSTADIAALFDMEAKDLRVILRKLGLGVGKGRKYGLVAEDVAKLKDHLTPAA